MDVVYYKGFSSTNMLRLIELRYLCLPLQLTGKEEIGQQSLHLYNCLWDCFLFKIHIISTLQKYVKKTDSWITWKKTVKYITVMVVVTNIGCNGMCFESIKRTKANATAPLKPPYDMTNFSTLLNLWRRNWFANAVKTMTPEIFSKILYRFVICTIWLS